MDHEQKIELTKKYTEEELEIAVPRCLSWPARANDYHGMMTVLKKSSTWVDKVDAEKKVKDNEAFLKTLFHLDMQTVGGMRINVGPSYIQFVCGPKSTVFEVSDLEFKEKTKEQLEFLQKRGGEKSPRQ